MRAIIIQPPLVQLNSPYPSGAYLYSFLNQYKKEHNLELDVKWYDLSIELFYEIFSKQGLTKLFDLTEKKALQMALDAEKKGEDETAFNLRRYINQKEHWIEWIEIIIAILCDGKSNSSPHTKNYSTRELCHSFIFSPFSPRGMRMENYLASKETEISIDDARFLASMALADLADYINAVFDSNFSLIKYAEHLATSEKSFSKFTKATKSPVLKEFYSKTLEKVIKAENKELLQDEKILFLITIPFPGVFASALATGKTIKDTFGNNAIVAIGGGYVNTELRDANEKDLFLYTDFIIYDRGYSSLSFLLEKNFVLDGETIYNVKYLKDNKIIGKANDVLDKESVNKEAIEIDDKYTQSIFPDYSCLDFSIYPRVADDINAMHRMWSDGSWIKVYLAHGCYWHRCAFCDTALDYVHSYKMAETQKLYEAIYEQAKQKSVYGIHFVDEASPPAALKRFALCNIRRNENCNSSNGSENNNTRTSCSEKTLGLNFWGNIRFEKTFTRDLTDLLSYGGMLSASGGIEIASSKGLQAINKGTDIDSLVGACAAFKESGILVHAYMIYGFYNETPEMLSDSMETLRQLFKNELVDSAFWHKFVLTKHSQLYTEWKQGLHPELKPQTVNNDLSFASNDLRFENENKSNKYTSGLDLALSNWMEGQGTDKPIQTWFDFHIAKPSIGQNYIEQAISRYEKRRDALWDDYEAYKKGDNKSTYWLGGIPLVLPSTDTLQLCWTYFGDMLYADFPSGTTVEEANNFAKSLNMLNPKNNGQKNIPIPESLYKAIRGQGLCRV